MLKFNKTRNASEITITLRDRDSFFSQPLLIAFVFALSFHLLFITIFHVAPFFIEQDHGIFPTIYIENVPLEDNSIVATIENTESIFNNLPIRPESSPQIPIHPLYINTQHMQEINSAIPLFTELEKDIYTPNFPVFTVQELPICEIKLAGMIAEQGQLLKGWEQYRPPSFHEDACAIFSVLIDSTGEIFWFTTQQSTSQPTLDRFAFNLVPKLRFETSSSTFTGGEIEIHFHANGTIQ